MTITPLWQLERAYIEHALSVYQGNRTHAAKALDISLRTIRNKIRQYKLTPKGQRPLALKCILKKGLKA